MKRKFNLQLIYVKTPRPHPWRPTMAFERLGVTPLPEVPITNQLVSPCFVPPGMSTEPLNFPNLVTGFDRNPQHAARAALYTRYTGCEWDTYTKKSYAEAEAEKKYSEGMRLDALRLMRETDEKTAQGLLLLSINKHIRNINSIFIINRTTGGRTTSW